MTLNGMPHIRFGEFLTLNKRPYTLGPTEDASLVGMRLYGHGPFFRELKPATKIQKKTHFVIEKHDVIYNKLFAWKGTFGIVPDELSGMFVSDKFPTYKLDDTQVDRNFLRWYFKYSPLWEQARQMSTGSAALSKLTLNPPRFMDLTIPRLSIELQQKIALKIECLAAKVAEAKKLRNKTKDETCLLPLAFLRRISERYPTTSSLSKVLKGKPRNGWSAKCDNVDGGVPVLTLTAVTGFHYERSAFKRTSLPTVEDAHYWLSPGDLLITRSNTPELVGHVAIYDGSPCPCIYPDLIMKLTPDEDVVVPRFLWCWLQTPLVRNYIVHNAKGTSPTMKKISQGIVMDIPFPVGIGLAEQNRIVEEFDKVTAKQRDLQRLQARTATELDAILPAILDRAFRGDL